MPSPFIRFILAYLLGSAAAVLVGPWPFPGWAVLASFCSLAASLLMAPRSGRDGGAGRWGRPLVLLLTALVAFGYYQWNDSRNQTAIVLPGQPAAAPAAGQGAMAEEPQPMPVRLTGILVTPVKVDGDKASFTLRTSVIALSGNGRPIVEKVQVSVRLLKQREQTTASALKRGDAVSLTGTITLPERARNFGGFDYRAYLKRQYIHYLVSVKGMDQVALEAAPSPGLTRIAGQSFAKSLGLRIERYMDVLREKLEHTVTAIFPADQSGYMKGLIIGVQDDIDPEQYRAFSSLGLTHLLAISGMHVALFTAALLWLFGRMGLTRESAMLFVILILPFYIVLTGSSPSIVRAGVMAMLGLYAARRGRLRSGLHLVAATALFMLLIEPYHLLNVGFQLSFLVTVGLILGVPPVSRLLSIKHRGMNSAVTVTLVAQAVSFPLTVYYFNQFSLASILANLALVPLVSFAVTPAGTIAMLVAFIYEPAGRVLAGLTAWGNAWSFRFVDLLNKPGGLRLIWPTPPIWWVVVYFALGGFILARLDRKRRACKLTAAGIRLPDQTKPLWGRIPLKPGFLLPAAALVFTLLLILSYNPLREPGTGEVTFLDVGQGDAILIRTPNGRHILVDGGGTLSFAKPGEEWKKRRDPYEVGRKTVVPLLKKRGVHTLDAVLITHLDMDHLGGLAAVIEEIPVSRIYFNGTMNASKETRSLFTAILARDIPLYQMNAGDSYLPDVYTRIVCLSPSGNEGQLIPRKSQNAESIVFLLRMRDYTFLLTGDMDKMNESDILKELGSLYPARLTAALPRLDVLKVAHHGSKTATSEAWLSFWRPRIAAISAGKNNSYGHPAQAVVERLERMGSAVYRTDQQGEIRITVGKNGLTVDTGLDQATGKNILYNGKR